MPVLVIAKELQLFAARHAEPKCPGRILCRVSGVRKPEGIGVSLIETVGDTAYARRVLCGQREDCHRIKRTAVWDHTACAEASAGRLQTDNVVEGSRDAPRSGGICAQRKARKPQRDGDGGPSARTSADVVRIETVAAGAVG